MSIFRELKSNLDKYCTLSGTQTSLRRLLKLPNGVQRIFWVAWDYLGIGNASSVEDTPVGGGPNTGGNTGESACPIQAFGLLAGYAGCQLKLTTGLGTLNPPNELLSAQNDSKPAEYNTLKTKYNPELSMFISEESNHSFNRRGGFVSKPGYLYSYAQFLDASQEETRLMFHADGHKIMNYYFKTNLGNWSYEFNKNKEFLYQFSSNSYTTLTKFNANDGTLYSYSGAGLGSAWGKIDSMKGKVSAGYGGNWEGNSSFAIIGNVGFDQDKIGIGYQTYYNYFYISSLANSDSMNLAIGNNNNTNYISLYADGSEASIWTYDLYGTSLLWNTKSEGKFHLYNDISFFQISVDSAYGESAFWGYDEQGNNILWNRRNDGIFQIYNNWTDTYFAFYGRGQSSFWFTHFNYTDLKFSSIYGILQVWNNDRRSYIDLSVYDIEPVMTCKFRYVKCNGKLVTGSNGQYVLVLSSAEFDICNPTTPSPGGDCDATSVIKYNNY